MRIILLLLVSLFAYTQTTNSQTQPKSMLLGIVLQKENQHPVENINICLEDQLSKERICFTTLTDGFFYFSLERDKQYWIHLMNETTDSILTSKKASTIGKDTPETLHVLFEY